jgi:hypothetical protein
MKFSLKKLPADGNFPTVDHVKIGCAVHIFGIVAEVVMPKPFLDKMTKISNLMLLKNNKDFKFDAFRPPLSIFDLFTKFSSFLFWIG